MHVNRLLEEEQPAASTQENLNRTNGEWVCPQRRGCGHSGRGCGQHPVCVMRSLTHLPVSVADGLCQRAPSLSVFHLHWCIVGQQQVGTLCREHGRCCRLKNNRNEPKFLKHQKSSHGPGHHPHPPVWVPAADGAEEHTNVFILKKTRDLQPGVLS